jgi:hypothetical protein
MPYQWPVYAIAIGCTAILLCFIQVISRIPKEHKWLIALASSYAICAFAFALYKCWDALSQVAGITSEGLDPFSAIFIVCWEGGQIAAPLFCGLIALLLWFFLGRYEN